MPYSFSKGRYTNNDRLRKYNFDADDADGTDKKICIRCLIRVIRVIRVKKSVFTYFNLRLSGSKLCQYLKHTNKDLSVSKQTRLILYHRPSLLPSASADGSKDLEILPLSLWILTPFRYSFKEVKTHKGTGKPE